MGCSGKGKLTTHYAKIAVQTVLHLHRERLGLNHEDIAYLADEAVGYIEHFQRVDSEAIAQSHAANWNKQARSALGQLSENDLFDLLEAAHRVGVNQVFIDELYKELWKKQHQEGG